MAATCVSFVQPDYLGTSPKKASTFNVESAILELMSDPTQVSLELPCLLNASQRKHAKKVAEQYPELKCESFGFGQDRQMHVFKQPQLSDVAVGGSMNEGSHQNVSVKNTFIDDWIVADAGPTNTRVVQSMPHNMFGKCLSEELSAGDELAPDDKDLGERQKVLDSTPKSHKSLEEEHFITLGSEVVIDGLVKAPSFNGARGIVQSWDGETGRYNVLLAAVPAEGQRLAKIKAENLHETRAR